MKIVLVSETSEIDYISIRIVEAHIRGSPRALGGFLNNIHAESEQLLVSRNLLPFSTGLFNFTGFTFSVLSVQRLPSYSCKGL